MNANTYPESDGGMIFDLLRFCALCEEALALVSGEGRSLAGDNSYRPTEFNELRKRLLPKLESSLIMLRKRRQDARPAKHSEETLKMFQTIQGLLMKVLLLDRENQQTLLKRGLVPARYLPPVAVQRPHFVTGLYQQHAGRPGGAPA
jgi:hypothetical protein